MHREQAQDMLQSYSTMPIQEKHCSKSDQGRDQLPSMLLARMWLCKVVLTSRLPGKPGKDDYQS